MNRDSATPRGCEETRGAGRTYHHPRHPSRGVLGVSRGRGIKTGNFSPPRRQVRQGKKGKMREISQKPLQNPWFDRKAQIDGKGEPGNSEKSA
jgi:hypothetical protein